MEKTARPSIKSKIEKQNKSSAWVRRSTRGPKDLIVTLDEYLQSNSDDDSISNSESKFVDKSEDREKVKNNGEHSSLDCTSVMNTKSDFEYSNGLSNILNTESQQETEVVNLVSGKRKNGRPRKARLVEDGETDIAVDVGASKRKQGRPRKAILVEEEDEDIYNLSEIEMVEQEEANVYLKDIDKRKRGRKWKSSQNEEDLNDSAGGAEKKKRKPRKNSLGEEGSSDDNSLQELLATWKELFASKVFKCISRDCPQHFVTWVGLFDHMSKCEFPAVVNTSITLLCHVCSKEFTLKPQFTKHMRLQHRDVYDLVHGLESGNTMHCFNYTCSAEIQTYEDCVQHGSQCGSLVYCDKCDKSYKTRVYFSSHSCIGERAKERKILVDGEYVTPSNDMVKRKAAKRRSVPAEEITDTELLAAWRGLFASKVFQCINKECAQQFVTWAGLYDHMNRCEVSGVVSTNITLLCHVCSKEFPLKPDFTKHMRLQHRDVYDLVHGLESGATMHCFNYTCSAEVQTYEDCVQHGSQCGSLVYCDKCDKSYKTRVYFSSHSCIGEKEKERQILVDGEYVAPSNDMAKRKAAKRRSVQTEEITDNELLAEWRGLFASKVFKCINKECAQHFVTWVGLFDHMNKCEFPGVVSASVTLLCHVCSMEFPLKPNFMKHIRVQHRDVYDLAHGLESGNTTCCFKYTCSAEMQTYEDCIQHGSQCGSLVYCDKCDKSYKTRVYFSNHSCVGEKVKESKLPKKEEFLTPLGDMVKRRAAKRALDAIHSNESDEVRGSSSNQLKRDNDFEAYSDSNEDSAEYEDDDDDDDDDDDGDENEGSNDGDGHDEISDQDGTECESRSEARQHLIANFTSVLRNPNSVRNKKIVPFKRNEKWLMKWYERNQSSYVFPEWTLSKDDIQFLSEREAADYFPPYRISPLFNVIYETKTQHALKTDFKQLKIFEVSHLEGSSITTMFVGGSVAAIEWCPCKGTCDQFLAVSTIGSFAQIAKRSKKRDMIQVWRVPNQASPCKTVTLSMTIAVESGPVFCMKWCPSPYVKEIAPGEIKRLGILAISCSDGCIRIISVPHPSSLETETKENKAQNERIAVKTKTVLILAPSRKSLKEDENSNEVACFEWQPSNEHEMIAAGYSDGTICIWKLKTESPLLRFLNENECCDVLLPFSRINAHLHCVNSLSWCPTDTNFIVSVGFEKSLKIFDIREKESPPLISLKRNMFEQCVVLLRVCGISAVEDELSNSLPVGSRFLDLIYHTLAQLPYSFSDHNTSHTSACLGIGNSEWMNAIATSCCAGEVLFRALSHKSRASVAHGGNSCRLPVYRTEVSDVTANEEGRIEIDSSVKEAINLSTSQKPTRNDTVKDDIRRRAQQLPMKIFKHKFTFKDSNFFEFRNKPGKCDVDVIRARCFKPNDRSNFSHDEMCHISRVKWNPNYGQHFVLATGGSLGFVRLHYFTKWK